MDAQLKEKDRQLKEKDQQLKENDEQLQEQSDGVIAKLKGSFANIRTDLGCVHQVLLKGYEKHDIVLRKFSKYSSEGGNWYSAPFYVYGDQGHPIKLNVDVRTGDVEAEKLGVEVVVAYFYAHVKAVECDNVLYNISCFSSY